MTNGHMFNVALFCCFDYLFTKMNHAVHGCDKRLFPHCLLFSFLPSIRVIILAQFAQWRLTEKTKWPFHPYQLPLTAGNGNAEISDTHTITAGIGLLISTNMCSIKAVEKALFCTFDATTQAATPTPVGTHLSAHCQVLNGFFY